MNPVNPGPAGDIVTFPLPHGEIRGRLCLPVSAEDLVVIVHGHNGFHSYGMFPWIQDRLSANGYGSFSFNFSHGGTRCEEDVFTDLEAYARNCMRLERDDVIGAVKALRHKCPGLRIWLLAHSMGSVPAAFGAERLLAMAIPLEGLVLLAPVSRLDFWPETLISEWSRTGTMFMRNRRTGQDLPHGPELLAEILRARDDWNMEALFRTLHLPLTVIHGLEDEAVSCRHGQDLVRWSMASGSPSRFVGLARTGHTFGTAHPFQGPAVITETMVGQVLRSLDRQRRGFR